MQSLVWLLILIVLVLAIIFLVAAPLHDGHSESGGDRSSRKYCSNEPGFFCVKHQQQSNSRSGGGVAAVGNVLHINGELNPTLHLRRGKEYVFWMCDPEDPTNRGYTSALRPHLSFQPLPSCQEDDHCLSQLMRAHPDNPHMCTVQPGDRCPAQFCYGTPQHPRLGHVFLFD